MAWQERIAVDPRVLAGEPVIKGTRLAVEFIVDLKGHGWSDEDTTENYPGVAGEDIRACLAYVAERPHRNRV